MAATSAAAAATAVAAAGPSALSLPVPFGFDSADLLPSAKPQLDAIAAGIRMLPATQRVVIEGHTDAVGTEQYNEQLSQRRAQAVRRYLVSMHGIDAGRLEAVGKGEASPLPGRAPMAGENRRVQFRGE
jgi:outer membrane protein OmpA-like peptidoglycan-associated protein